MEATQYQCPNCGAPLTFSEKKQKLSCESCGAAITLDELRKDLDAQIGADGDKGAWEPYDANSGNGDWSEAEASHLRAYSCPACGAQIIADENTAATTCVYCQNPTILPVNLTGAYRPDIVIPFKLDKKAAMQAYRDNCKGKRLLAKSFAEESQVEKLAGVYIPYWLYDCDASASIRYAATRVDSHREGKYEVTHTRHYDVYRAGKAGFSALPVDGSTKFADEITEAIEPFDYADAKDFDAAYLSGFLADKYDLDANACAPRASERVHSSMTGLLDDTVVGYATCTPVKTGVSVQNGRTRYALMPVWMLNAKYRGKTYTFAMNGQTGRFVGTLPMSLGRFFAWFGGLTAGLSAAAFLAVYLIFLMGA